MKIIVGLGNPGKQYQRTRHNLGYEFLDLLAEQLGLSWRTSKKLNSKIAKDDDLILLKPQTFMNDSGRAVAQALSYYRFTPAELTVIHDDLDIALGKYKVSADSTSAGHKGVQSIIDQLKTKNFRRMRIGIGQKPNSKIPAEKYVLQKFSQDELLAINRLIKEMTAKIIM